MVTAGEEKPVPSAGEAILIAGGVLSMLSVVKMLPVMPAESVTLELIC